MNEVLTGPVLAAAGVMCVATVGKLRDPAGAVRALGTLGLPARRWVVWALCAVELAAAGAVLVAPAALPSAVLAGVYGMFAGAGAALRSRGAGCGCFGEAEARVSLAHVGLSGGLALVCAAGAVWPPHGLGWALARPALAVGVVGCVYAIVLAYTQLPLAWGAWRAQ